MELYNLIFLLTRVQQSKCQNANVCPCAHLFSLFSTSTLTLNLLACCLPLLRALLGVSLILSVLILDSLNVIFLMTMIRLLKRIELQNSNQLIATEGGATTLFTVDAAQRNLHI